MKTTPLNNMIRLSLLALSLGASTVYAADGTIKVGVLHSLSGTMAISETTLKDTMLMLIDEQNKKGGLLGKKLEPVVVDPASNWPLFAEKARELIEKDKVAAVFGCRITSYNVCYTKLLRASSDLRSSVNMMLSSSTDNSLPFLSSCTVTCSGLICTYLRIPSNRACFTWGR